MRTARTSSTSSPPTASWVTVRSSTFLTRPTSAPCSYLRPRKSRFRVQNASMSRFYKLALSYNGAPVPFRFIANDGNLVVNPIVLTALDEQGVAERYDIVVDFSAFPVGSRIYLVNLLKMRDDGRGPQEPLSLAPALAGLPEDPAVGKMME